MFQTKHLLQQYTIAVNILRKYTGKPELKTFTQKKQYYGDLFPDKLLNKKQKTPSHLYITNEQTAHQINKHLEPFFQQSPCDTILELNPGIGAFTRRLLDNEEKFKKIILMETMDYFMGNLQEMHTLYPERVKVKQGDLVNIWKLVYQDKMDNGSRVQDLLRDIPNRQFEEEPNILLFGAVGSYQFFKHLINSIIFQNSFLNLGRAEMYFVVPPPIYLHLTCTSEIGYMIYRSTSILFQMLFEYRFIARLPRDEFLPAQTEYNFTKGSKLGRVRSVNPEFLYLVRIVPRRDIYKYVAPEDMPSLWYFVKQNCVSRRNRIIPNLEKWIPGCGPRLIINAEEPQPSVPLYDDEDIAKLPKYSSRCCTINNNDYYPNINIYTQFGDLRASQMLTLFSLFRKWPEYKESSFLASFENSMLKMEASAEESVEGIAEEDDDISVEQTPEEDGATTTTTTVQKVNAKRSRKLVKET
ncbi:dimethyladenosine transferase 2, mitochondrial [Lucilia sericata]|uniref:dimethyladenosine transferase 2, mitochondrial n=1 Tax=Lucilia sericata TaxID=13632 RepID=UPI0018A85F8A|nr:dimethyladenosine transferase 2, mitochondrial [Lucilia sericata]